jgi:hypothetical protein
MIGKELSINTWLHYSRHARTRMDQRAVRKALIAYAMLHGKIYDRAGARWYVVRWKDMPAADRKDSSLARAAGLVVCEIDGVVETVYKRERPGIYIRKKPKNDCRRNQRRKEQFGYTPQDNQRFSAS